MDDPFASLVKMISSLLLVLGLILAVAFGARRFLRSRFSRWQGDPLIQVISTAYLGPKKEVSIIEVGRQYLVVGVTPNHISLLTHLDEAPLRAGTKGMKGIADG
ncbi:MAG: flagellar biosynthetic protein FliO [Nitrospiria bacterium]